jgi:predicted nuclease of predicted toxin-antitoxin system
MKFKIDENLPIELLEDLHAEGHEAETVPSEGLTGAPDSLILEKACSEDRILLTLDKGIADVRVYPPERYASIILFRPPSTGRGTVLSFVRRHLPVILGTEIAGHLLVVTDRNIRMR